MGQALTQRKPVAPAHVNIYRANRHNDEVRTPGIEIILRCRAEIGFSLPRMVSAGTAVPNKSDALLHQSLNCRWTAAASERHCNVHAHISAQ